MRFIAEFKIKKILKIFFNNPHKKFLCYTL